MELGQGVSNFGTEQGRHATETLTGSSPGIRTDEESLARGTAIGRYVILGWLGSGGMGRVFAAYDPDLDRRIALKLVRPALRSADAPARLLREAQAMAKLAHPNVVSIYDVGQHRDQIFLAMEFIDGLSLRDWLQQGAHDWQDVIRVFRRAGRGLQAAHDAGLVHRDFKPSNVLIARDGQVRIADLGLARGLDPWVLETPRPSHAKPDLANPERRSGGLLAAPLTRSRTPVGSPAYMAPEQYALGQADARSDQFSFCVALFEALHGIHPFDGSGDGVGGQHRAEAQRVEPTEPAAVPTRVHAVIERGLAIDPSHRFPSLANLLEALARASRPRRRSWLTSTIAGGSLILGLLIWQRIDAPRLDASRLAAQRLEGIWDPASKQRLRIQIEGSGSPLASETWPYLEPLIDAYAGEWSKRWIAARDTVRLAGSDASSLAYRRLACLDQRLLELQALTRLLADGDRDIVAGAMLAAQKLPDLSACARLEEAGTETELPSSDLQPPLAKVRVQLAEARTLGSAEVPTRGLPLAQEALATAQSLRFPPVTARAHRVLGSLYAKGETFENAAFHLEEGLWMTLTAGQVEDAAMIAADLTDLARQQARRDDQRRWLRMAEALGQRQGSPPSLLARLGFERGRWLHDTAQFEPALTELRQTLAHAQQAHGLAHEKVADLLFGLGAASVAVTRYADAVDYFEQALAIDERVFGPRHPEVAETLNGLGVALRRRGQDADAIATFERALEIRQSSLGAQHSAVAATLNNLANVHGDRLEYGRAIELLQQAEAIFRQALGPEHPRVATCLLNLGRLSAAQHSWAEAASYLDQAVALAETVQGVNHPQVAEVLQERSQVYRQQGDLSRARQDLQRAEQIYEHALGPKSRKIAVVWSKRARLESDSGHLQAALDHQLQAAELLQGLTATNDPMTAATWRTYADYLLTAGRSHEAVKVAEQALSDRARSSSEPAVLAEYRFTLARASMVAGGDREAAVALAREAGAALETKPGQALQRQEIQAWLERHEPPSS